MRRVVDAVGSSNKKVKSVKKTFENLDYDKITKNQEKFFIAMEKILAQLNDLDTDYDDQKHMFQEFMKNVQRK